MQVFSQSQSIEAENTELNQLNNYNMIPVRFQSYRNLATG